MVPRRYARTIAVFGACYIGWYFMSMTRVYVNSKIADDRSTRGFTIKQLLVSAVSKRGLTRTVEQRLPTAASNTPVQAPNWQKTLAQRKPSNHSSYYLTAVVRIRLYKEDKAKWTFAEFKQWMHYQFWAGAEHIYVCNHYLNESENLQKPLEKYVQLGLVTFFTWNHIKAVRGSSTYVGDNARNQDGCYQHVLEKYGNQSVWQYNFDMDENPYCPNDQSEGFLTRFLKALSESESENVRQEQTVDIRVQNFILHGQGDRTRDTVYDRINRITPDIANGNWKTIYKPKFIEDIGMHGVKVRHGKMWIAPPTQLKMLHYWGARQQEWGPDTPALYKYTILFNDVRNSIAVGVKNSLLALKEMNAFSRDTGP